jgi:plastocyanin
MKRLTLLIICIVALCGAGYAGWQWYDMQRTVVVVISDDAPRALPQTVELIRGVRDTLIIRNETNKTALIAGRSIAPGQEARQRFLSAGEYTFACTTHQGADVAVIVRDP